MQIVQTVAGVPKPTESKNVTITDTPQTLLTLLSVSLATDAKTPKFAYIYVTEGTLGLSSRSNCPEAEGIAIGAGNIVKLSGFPEISKFYLRTYTAGSTVEVAVEMEY